MYGKRKSDTDVNIDKTVPICIRVGKDEMNLIELPFTLLSSRNPNSCSVIERHWQGVGEDGKVREFYKIVTGHPQFGLPTFQAEEVYIALMEVTNRQGFTSRRVHTTQYEILKIMRWKGGNRYKALIRSLDQMGAVWISTNAFWNNETSSYEKVGFGIIDDYRFFEQERRGKRKEYESSLPLGFVDWNQILFDSFKRGFIKTLDSDIYFGLTTNTAKRLFRYIDKHLYRGEVQEIDLFRLAFDKLEMSGNYRFSSQIIRELKDAITELKEKEIAVVEIVESKTTTSGYKVVFSPITKPQVMVHQLSFKENLSSGSEEAKESEADSLEESNAVGQLTQRGMTIATARRLAKVYPAEQIQKQVEVFDWLKERKSLLVERNPGGFLRKAIEENYQPPKEYLEQKDKRDKEQKKENRRERWRRYREELIGQGVANWDKVSPERRIEGRLSFWIASETMKGRKPTLEQIEVKKQELIDGLPQTDEERWEYLSQNYPEDPPEDFE